MKFLWISLIVVSACLVTFVAISHHHNQDRTSGLNLTGFANKPIRIVSLAPNLTEILFALGLGERVIAVSSDSDYPVETANKNKVGTFWSPNTEAIIASKPDLVITEWFQQQTAVADSLRRLGYQVLTLNIEKIEELFAAIEKIGDATGYEKHADELAKDISKQLNDLQQELASANKVKVLWVVQVEPLRVAGRNTFVNELIELAGGENAIGSTIAQYPAISSEELLVCGAEAIIQSAMGAGDLASQQQAAEVLWSRWSSLSAVKNNRIYVVQPNTTLRLGPRLSQGVELIAHYLHPEIFAQTSCTTQ